MSSLPVPATRFVGRDAELAEVSALLTENRLLTLTGPGGAGKTRLALQLASAAAADFSDGVWFADLSPLSSGEFVWDQLAVALGVREQRDKALSDAVGARLATRQALLVIDNCEHVVASVAEVADSVLTAAPAVKVIATSREPLGVAGEVIWTVPPLTETDATELFVDRARQAWPKFSLRDSDRQAVRSICERLDGLPLAIELAAARTRILDPEQIAAGLRDRLLVLPKGPRTAPRRQATLEASFDWSYELLSDAERALLRQLSVFAGGFGLDAALAVCPAASLDLLAALAERSLIVTERGPGHTEPRYRMLETVRQFAAEHLDEADEVVLMRNRHRDYYQGVAETAEPHLLGPDEDSWRARLSIEQDNLRAALAWSRDQGDAELLARMVAALYWFWAIPGRFTEFRMWLETAAERATDLSPTLRARFRNFECLLAVLSGRLAEVPALGNEALTLAREAGDQREEALALLYLGGLAGLLGGAQAMRPYFEEGLALARSTGYALAAVQGLELFLALRWFQSDPEETRRLAEEVVEFSKSMDRHHRLDGVLWAGMTALFQGRLGAAAQLFEKDVAEGRETNDLNYFYGMLMLALVTMFRGDATGAARMLEESWRAAQFWEVEARSMVAFDRVFTFVQGWMQLTSGDAPRAIGSLMPIVEALRSTPVANWAAVPLVLMAEAQVATGAVEEAAANLEEVTSLSRRGAMTWSLGRASRVRARLAARQGHLNEAESEAHEALRLADEAGDQLGLVDALELLARLAVEQDSHQEAVRLWAAADSMRNRLGYRLTPPEAAIANAKEHFTEFAAAWAEGAKLSAEEAIAYAARGRGERKRPATGWASLTPSELEVARLVGEHLSNPEIAARLFISRATVKTHLVHIFAKLGIESRSELAAQAISRRQTSLS